MEVEEEVAMKRIICAFGLLTILLVAGISESAKAEMIIPIATIHAANSCGGGCGMTGGGCGNSCGSHGCVNPMALMAMMNPMMFQPPQMYPPPMYPPMLCPPGLRFMWGRCYPLYPFYRKAFSFGFGFGGPFGGFGFNYSQLGH